MPIRSQFIENVGPTPQLFRILDDEATAPNCAKDGIESCQKVKVKFDLLQKRARKIGILNTFELNFEKEIDDEEKGTALSYEVCFASLEIAQQ